MASRILWSRLANPAIRYTKLYETILITGGSDGLGKAIATRLAPNNKVILLSPTEGKLKAVAKELGCEHTVCDVRDYVQVEQTINQIGAIDCLVNNAGLWIQGPLDENDPERIRQVIEVNTLGVINMTKAVIPIMKQQVSGLIININSQGGFYAKAERSVYTATRWAITGEYWTKLCIYHACCCAPFCIWHRPCVMAPSF